MVMIFKDLIFQGYLLKYLCMKWNYIGHIFPKNPAAGKNDWQTEEIKENWLWIYNWFEFGEGHMKGIITLVPQNLYIFQEKEKNVIFSNSFYLHQPHTKPQRCIFQSWSITGFLSHKEEREGKKLSCVHSEAVLMLLI